MITGETAREIAMERLLKFIDSRNTFPYQGDYDREFTEAEQYQLLRDLGVEKDLELFKTENPRLAIYAILNIEALRYRRGPSDEPDEYAKNARNAAWHQRNDNIFT